MEGKVGKLGCRYMAGGLEESEMDRAVSETMGGEGGGGHAGSPEAR